MGLLNQKGKDGSKKSGKGTQQKNNNSGSKFINKTPKGGGSVKKGMTGGSQRGS